MRFTERAAQWRGLPGGEILGHSPATSTGGRDTPAWFSAAPWQSPLNVRPSRAKSGQLQGTEGSPRRRDEWPATACDGL